jgi:hypothetical protein
VPLAEDVVPLPVVVLLVAPVLLAIATGAVVSALDVAAVVADCCEPNATQPPIVPTIAALAIADFRRAANIWRREVSLRVIIVCSRRSCLPLPRLLGRFGWGKHTAALLRNHWEVMQNLCG